MEVLLTHMNFMETSLKPFSSKRWTILPTSPRWTPSGLIMMKVRSLLPDMALIPRETKKKTVKKEMSIN